MQATTLAADALAEAKRLNDLYVAAAADAYAARSEAGVLREQLANTEEFATKAYAEAQRINALLLDAQTEAAALRILADNHQALPSSLDEELLEARRLLQLKIQESQERLEHVQVAWAEATRINDLYVTASRRAVTAELDATSLRQQLAEMSQRIEAVPVPDALRPPVVERLDSGRAMVGSWTADLEFDQELRELGDFVADHRPSGGQPDIAVLLMFPGWENELRGNRWHVAKFLSSRMRVILVQPAQLYTRGGPRLVPERRIKNTWILETLTHQPHWPDECDEAMLHARDIEWAVRRLGGVAPLYWLFSPYLAKAFIGLASGYKLIHATEDWVKFPGLPPWAMINFNEALAEADLVVAVSDGVRDNISDRVSPERLITVSNGCDFDAYSQAQPHRTFAELRKSWKKIAVFAGNIDYRIDYGLLKKAAESEQETVFALIGPVRALDREDAETWGSILKLRNVRWFGPFDPDLLPSVYAGADLGIIPYKGLEFIVQSNFSLKLLEMAAAGLPVVTTQMASVKGLADALVVTEDEGSFLDGLKALSRGSLPDHAAIELRAVASRSDYSEKFAFVLNEIVRRHGQRGPTRQFDLRKFASQIQMWRASLAAYASGEIESGRRGLLRAGRDLRLALGRKHPTARKILIDLSRTLAGRPEARLLFLSAALGAGDEDLRESLEFRNAAVAHCSTAVTLGRYEAALESGWRAWRALQAEPGDPALTADLLLNLCTALVETQADPQEVDDFLTSVSNAGLAGGAIKHEMLEILRRYIDRKAGPINAALQQFIQDADA